MLTYYLVYKLTNLVNGKIQSADGVRHLFIDPKCKESIKCFEQLCYKEGTNDPDKDSGMDHIPDSAGYYIYTKFAYLPAQRKQSGHMQR